MAQHPNSAGRYRYTTNFHTETAAFDLSLGLEMLHLVRSARGAFHLFEPIPLSKPHKKIQKTMDLSRNGTGRLCRATLRLSEKIGSVMVILQEAMVPLLPVTKNTIYLHIYAVYNVDIHDHSSKYQWEISRILNWRYVSTC